MASSSVKLENEGAEKPQGAEARRPICVIVADTQAIFRVGLRKIFALEDDIRVVAQADSFGQTLIAASKFTADVILFESALASDPGDAISELLRRAPSCKLVVLTSQANEEQTLEYFRRGAHGIAARNVAPEVLIQCVRKVAQGENWLDKQATHWVLEAFRTQKPQVLTPASKAHLTQKEALIVSCVTQGMKNKEIAQRVGTTEQVVKNYLRKVYDKLGVSDRLELALFCLNHHLVEGAATPANKEEPAPAAASQPGASGEPA